MTVLNWAINGAAILVLIYGIRVALQTDREPQPGKRAGLGCGFLLAACLLWGLASHAWVGGYLAGVRLGLGAFLVTPALGALTKPHGSRLALGLVGLVAGVLLAGPVLRDLVRDGQAGDPARAEPAATDAPGLEAPAAGESSATDPGADPTAPDENAAAEELYEQETDDR